MRFKMPIFETARPEGFLASISWGLFGGLITVFFKKWSRYETAQ